VIGEQIRPAKQDEKQYEEADIEDSENDYFHVIIAIRMSYRKTSKESRFPR
jgi:hypothetical protein